jgi:hypothetical protein
LRLLISKEWKTVGWREIAGPLFIARDTGDTPVRLAASACDLPLRGAAANEPLPYGFAHDPMFSIGQALRWRTRITQGKTQRHDRCRYARSSKVRANAIVRSMFA